MPNVVRMKLHAALRHYLALSTLEAGGSEPLEARRHNDPVTSRRTALVVGGTGPTGPLVVNGLIERGYDVTILHTGRHQTDLIGSEVRRIYTDPFNGEATAEVVADELGHSWELVSLPYELAAPARPLVGSWSTTHRVLDIGPTVRDLGYRDVLAPIDAWRAATRWLVENPLERGGALEQRLGDPFDYDAEDRLIAAWNDARHGLETALGSIDWSREPNYGSAYVGNRPNPGVAEKRQSLNAAESPEASRPLSQQARTLGSAAQRASGPRRS